MVCRKEKKPKHGGLRMPGVDQLKPVESKTLIYVLACEVILESPLVYPHKNSRFSPFGFMRR